MADLDKEPFMALCRADDAQGMLALLGRLGLSHTDEVVLAQRAIEFAIEADAPKTFESLLEWAAEQGEPNGLLQRLWGGVTPLHQCAFVSDGFPGPNTEAPKCMAVALRLDPLGATRLDEDGRSTLDWAAMSDKKECFGMLLDSVCSAVERGELGSEEAKALGVRAGLKIPATTRQWRVAAERLSALKKRLGIDWPDLVGPDGQTVLGSALTAGRGGDILCAYMVLAGAPIDSLCVPQNHGDDESPRAEEPAWQAVFRSPNGISPPRLTMTMMAMAERMDDPFLMVAMEHLRASANQTSLEDMSSCEPGLLGDAKVVFERWRTLSEKNELDGSLGSAGPRAAPKAL